MLTNKVTMSDDVDDDDDDHNDKVSVYIHRFLSRIYFRGASKRQIYQCAGDNRATGRF